MIEQGLRAKNSQDDELQLRDIMSVLWQGKWIVIITTFIFAIGSVFYALSLPNIYKSEAILAPVNAEAGMRLPGQLGGLAALAGVNLKGGGADKTALAMEILKSRDFLGRFIEKYDLYLPVMAAKGWNMATDSLVLDDKKYDQQAKQWIREVKPPFKSEPSMLETYEELIKLISISQDKATGMVRLSVQHYSPKIAKEWVDLLIVEINDDLKRRELREAENSIKYLNKQIEMTTLSDARAMLYSLVEEQVKTVMLANARDEFVLSTIDPAYVSEKKAKPSRALICILYTVLGFIFSILFVLARKLY